VQLLAVLALAGARPSHTWRRALLRQLEPKV
jgi:hypothetical protein